MHSLIFRRPEFENFSTDMLDRWLAIWHTYINAHQLAVALTRKASNAPNEFHWIADAGQGRVGQPLFGVSRVC